MCTGLKRPRADLDLVLKIISFFIDSCIWYWSIYLVYLLLITPLIFSDTTRAMNLQASIMMMMWLTLNIAINWQCDYIADIDFAIVIFTFIISNKVSILELRRGDFSLMLLSLITLKAIICWNLIWLGRRLDRVERSYWSIWRILASFWQPDQWEAVPGLL